MRGQFSRGPAGLTGRCEVVVRPARGRPFAATPLVPEQVRLDVVDERGLVVAPHDRRSLAANVLHDPGQAAHLARCLTLSWKHEHEIAAPEIAHPLLMLCSAASGSIPRRGEDPSNGSAHPCPPDCRREIWAA